MSDFRSPPDSIRTFLENTPVPLTVADPHQPDAPLVLVNNGFCELTGYGLDEMIGQNCRFLQGEKDQPTARADIREALSHGADMQVVLDNQRKDGSRFQNLLLLSTIRCHGGHGAGLAGPPREGARRRIAEVNQRNNEAAHQDAAADVEQYRIGCPCEARRIVKAVLTDAGTPPPQAHCTPNKTILWVAEMEFRSVAIKFAGLCRVEEGLISGLLRDGR